MKLKTVELDEITGVLPCQYLTLRFDAPEPFRLLSIVWASPGNRLEFADKLRSIAQMIEATPQLDEHLRDEAPR